MTSEASIICRSGIGVVVVALFPMVAAAADPVPVQPISPPAAVAPPTGPVVSGYIQGLFTQPLDDNDDGTRANSAFGVKRLRVRLKGEAVPKVEYVVMADLSTPTNLLRDAYISLRHLPHHELRIGQQKTQFGYENVESSTRLYTINRSYVSDSLGRGPDLRDIGLGLLGDWALPRGLGIDYQMTLVDGAGPNVAADDTDRKNLWGRAGISYRAPLGRLTARLGSSLGMGNQLKKGATAAADVVYDFRRWGVDVVIDTPWLWAAAEAVFGRNEFKADDVRARGAYAVLVGRLPGGLGPLVRVDLYDPDVEVARNRLRRLTLGVYLDLKPTTARLLINYEHDLSPTPVAKDGALYAMAQVLF